MTEAKQRRSELAAARSAYDAAVARKRAGIEAGPALEKDIQEKAANLTNALKALNFQVIAAGASYNDTGMLGAADAGFFIHPPESITKQFPQYPVNHSYAELRANIDAASARLLGR